MARKKKPGDPALVVGYVRVSTEDQALSPDAQRDALEAWCETQGRALVEICEDIGFSGASDIDKRPGLLEALTAVRENNAGILLVSRLDRLSRDVVQGGLIERLFVSQGATVMTCDGAGNAKGPEGELLKNLLRSVAQYERQIIAARTRAVLEAKRKRGLRYNCRAPFGYGWTHDGRIEPLPEEQRTIAMIRSLHGDGRSVREIAEHLQERISRHRPRGQSWHPTTVHRILCREDAEG